MNAESAISAIFVVTPTATGIDQIKKEKIALEMYLCMWIDSLWS